MAPRRQRRSASELLDAAPRPGRDGTDLRDDEDAQASDPEEGVTVVSAPADDQGGSEPDGAALAGATALDQPLPAHDQETGRAITSEAEDAADLTGAPTTRPFRKRRGQQRRRQAVPPAAAQEPSVVRKVSLPRWLNDQVRDLWTNEGASFAELIVEVLAVVDALDPSDPARVPSADEVKDWRRQLRLHPGSDLRTLRLSPAVMERVQQLADESGTDVGFSTMVSMLLSAHHPSITAPAVDRSVASN